MSPFLQGKQDGRQGLITWLLFSSPKPSYTSTTWNESDTPLQFFDVYREVLETHPFTPARVWNMEETGIANVQKPGKIVATKGVRQVEKMPSGERRATVTVICAMCAAGVCLPPMFTFPRKRMVTALLHEAPPQPVGYASPFN